MKTLFTSTAKLQILAHFVLTGEELYAAQLMKQFPLSVATVHHALKDLLKEGLLLEKHIGRTILYSLNEDKYQIRGFKKFVNLLLLEPLVEELKLQSRKVVVFGSWNRGDNIRTSDIDLYIVSRREKSVLEIVRKYSESEQMYGHRIQVIIADTLSSLLEDAVFKEQVSQGTIVWEQEMKEDSL